MILHLLGPAGTFSHDAALHLFPDAECVFMPHFDALFFTLSASPDRVGFVPIENSLHGSVDDILDLQRETDVKLWKTYEVTIRHAFGARKPSHITAIASHPQALKQCRQWLQKEYPMLEHLPVISTARAIEMAAQDESIGAIGLAESMERAGLPVIAKGIEGASNTTRFGIVSLRDPFPDAVRQQMSIVLHPREDYPGLLHTLLTPFKIYDVNLTRIENRPVGGSLGDYYFFLDFFGSPKDPRTQKVLKELERLAEVKVLGEW